MRRLSQTSASDMAADGVILVNDRPPSVVTVTIGVENGA
jgi:hypothetical protein